MPKLSAGLLLYRTRGTIAEVFLVHPGGPFWAKKEKGAWSIPKGEFLPEEDALSAARREFLEETGFSIEGEFRALAPLQQPSGKIVHAWAVEGDCPTTIQSNTFTMEWPPHSGLQGEFPEVDRAAWFTLKEAEERIVRGQVGFLREMQEHLKI